jgi:hypothetical protein
LKANLATDGGLHLLAVRLTDSQLRAFVISKIFSFRNIP